MINLIGIIGIIAVVAIAIAFLGLLGMTMYHFHLVLDYIMYVAGDKNKCECHSHESKEVKEISFDELEDLVVKE